MLSIRSQTPPCPFITVPVSFTLAFLFCQDWMRSPMTQQMDSPIAVSSCWEGEQTSGEGGEAVLELRMNEEATI